MNGDKLTTALTVTFIVSVLFLFAELIFLLRRRRVFCPQSPQPPISGDNNSQPKNLHYFFCLKSDTRVEPSEAPNGIRDEYSPDDPVIDVFKLLEANGPTRVLCTIKEDDRQEVESTSMSGVDSVQIPATGIVSLQACLDVEAEIAKAVLSSPSDSTMFFTPIGSPAPGDMSSEFVSPVSGN